MGRAPCCDKANVKKGPWSPEEDSQLKRYIQTYGTAGNWVSLPQRADSTEVFLWKSCAFQYRRCGKSCRLRWLNYLRPNIKHGQFSPEEDEIICTLFATIGSRWSIIAAQLPGRTDNDIKNYWNTKLKKKLMGMVSLFSSTNNTNTNYNPQTIKKTQSLSSLTSHQNVSNNIVANPITEPLSYYSPSTSSIPQFNYGNPNPFDQCCYEARNQIQMGFEFGSGLINPNNNGFEENYYHDQQMMMNNNNNAMMMDYGGMLKNMEEEEKKIIKN